ncbi:DUF3592 domain-containing protein [Myxococcus sp. K38C18041901]|uniref:DUF3592 domain-containing protein n=1 Tax=Myxococcus guangdongensis TaxID=2906760 RepID=UPI0020A7AF4C|nr:DUF3592 domain-containing protein [Myxococcus guangdongensis]MCP3063678.1 DUF3592 domain-containing protein [Myxococcus guangdongensis]
MTWLGTGVFGVAGALLLVLSASLARSAHDFDTHAVDVAGVISGHQKQECTRTDNKNRSRTYTCYQYRVRYETDGVAHESPVEMDRTDVEDRLGESVKLRVDPRTQKVHFAGTGPWVGPIATGVFGLLCLGAAVLIRVVFKNG